ncbi:MAG: 50S ribosomal protein L1 [Candidatus Saganbacteria bacterium]|nr:50S ribosomal protein L1 [Candidatus Saganbacteria bacterium]
MVRGKKYSEKKKMVEAGKFYSLSEAIKLIKQAAFAKFDESIDLAMKLNADPKKHSVRGTVVLPAGSGKTKKVAVITKGAKVAEAETAGADIIGSDDLVEKIQKGFLDFDVLIVSPDMMAVVGKLGKVLGPKGMMPNPKTGTVTMEIGKAVKEFKGGKTEFKMDKTSALHMILGKVSFEAADLEKNFLASIAAINHTKPSGTKGYFMKSVTLSSTMGPGVKIDPKFVAEKVEKAV